MALPNGNLVRFPILDSTGNEINYAISQRAATAALNGKMGINDAYTKAEINKMFTDNVSQALGQSTTLTISQKKITDELGLRYTKTESDARYYTKDQVNAQISNNNNLSMNTGQAGNIDLGVKGVFVGWLPNLGGTRPPTGDRNGRLVSDVNKYSSTRWFVYQTVDIAPDGGNDLSGDTWQRYYEINPTNNAVSSNTGWSRMRYRWSRD